MRVVPCRILRTMQHLTMSFLFSGSLDKSTYDRFFYWRKVFTFFLRILDAALLVVEEMLPALQRMR